MIIRMIAVCLLILVCGAACGTDGPVTLKTLSHPGARPVRIEINPGANWIHVTPYNAAPQFAVWLEDLDGDYMDTVFVTAKSARQGWVFADDDRKPGALPVWSHRRGVTYADGLYMPVKEDPLPDAITAASPRAQCTIEFAPAPTGKKIRVFLEFNHSTDWNAAYRAGLAADDPLHTIDVGQPSVVFTAEVDPSSPGTVLARLAGKGSVTGTTGEIDANVNDLTTALHIVESIRITVE